MKHTVLIVEDDESIRRLLEVTLGSQGYETRGFDSAVSALAALEDFLPDVAVMDVMMEGMDGVTALRLMRGSPRLKEIPVILLTARSGEEDKITGLDAGADDYLTKPFSVLELCARVRALLRRSGRFGERSRYAGGDLTLDIDTREVLRDGARVELTLKEFDLLKALMAESGKALTREELLSRVWGAEYYGETRTLDIHIGTLRQKLQDTPENSRYIKTVRGVGYRFVGGERP